MIDYAPLGFRVDKMRPEDINRVMEIEQVSFSAPWSARAYDYELHYNEMARYFVARPQASVSPGAVSGNGLVERQSRSDRKSFWRRLFRESPAPPAPAIVDSAPVVGYSGYWLMVDEAHISTIAAHPEWRRRGVGELLLVSMIDAAAEMDASTVTLEVRVSNLGAQALYRKYGFEQVGVRKRYYSDNGEDAFIMTTPRITGAAYTLQMQSLKSILFSRLSR